MKYLYIFLLVSLNVFSQENKIDSLKNVLSSSQKDLDKLGTYNDIYNEVWINNKIHELDSVFIQEMNSIARHTSSKDLEVKSYMLFTSLFMKQEKQKLANFSIKNALKLNDSIKNLELHFKIQNLLGRMYHHFGDFDLAIKTYKYSIDKYEHEPKGDIIYKLYSNLASSYRANADRDNEIKALIKALEYASKFDNKDDQAYNYYTIAWTYMNNENYSKSAEYFLNGIDFIEKENLTKYTYFHHGLGLTYSRWGKYDLALKHNSIALDFFRKSDNIRYEFDTLNNIAVVYNRMNNPLEGEKYSKQALTVAKEINHPKPISIAKFTIAVAQKDQGNYSQAEKTFMELLKDTLTFKKDNLQYMESLYANFSDIYFETGRYKDSYLFLKKQMKITDSINKTNLESKFSDIETKYQTEKKEKEIIKLRAEKAEQEILRQKDRLYNWIFASGLLLTSFVCLLLYYYLKKRKKQIKVEQYKYNQEVHRLQKLKEHQQQKINKQSQQIDNLHQTIYEKEEFSKTKFEEKEELFHELLSDKFKLTNTLLQYWIDQSNGLTEKEMMKLYNKSSGGIEGRRKRLYEKIKVIEDIDSNIWLSREEATRIYRENWQDFIK